MDKSPQQEIWFLTGSQHLYGAEALKKVAEHAAEIAGFLDRSGKLPVRLVFKPILTTPDEIQAACQEANNAPQCIGIVTWMHTFSPAKMWIAGLTRLAKPMAHLHTQYNRELPWAEIDMDFMNLNQSAHGDREFGFIGARLRMDRCIVVGFWQDEEVLAKLDLWARAAMGLAESRQLKIGRFGGANMREVAVTGGDRVEAQIKFGWAINGYAVGDLVKRIDAVDEALVAPLLDEYEALYQVAPELLKGGARRESLRRAARQELGMRAFLKEKQLGAFTTTFEDLYGMDQLPGLACQRLMAEGYGFGAEGDWKTAAMVRVLKVMGQGLKGGASLMEDYTYHLAKGEERILGSHMLEICPSIAEHKPTLEVHPLGIGGKADPCRLVFAAGPGAGVNATLVDLGGRMRLVVNDLDVVRPSAPMPKLPVACAVWIPQPDFKRGCEAWILAGGAHHSAFTQALSAEHLETFAGMVGIEMIHINADTRIPALKQELRWNDAAYRLNG